MKHTSVRALSVVLMLSAVLFVGAGCGKKGSETTNTQPASNINTASTVESEPSGNQEEDLETIEDALNAMQEASDSAESTLNDVDEENVDDYTLSEEGI